MTDEVRIVAIVYFENGSQGFEKDYDTNMSVGQYVKLFEAETIRIHNASTATVLFIEKTVHEDDGSVKIDDKGDRIMERLYTNKDLERRLFGR